MGKHIIKEIGVPNCSGLSAFVCLRCHIKPSRTQPSSLTRLCPNNLTIEGLLKDIQNEYGLLTPFGIEIATEQLKYKLSH